MTSSSQASLYDSVLVSVSALEDLSNVVQMIDCKLELVEGEGRSLQTCTGFN